MSADKPDPKDGLEEFQNGLDLLGDLITGKQTPRQVLDAILEKAFPSDEKKPEGKGHLRSVDGGRR